MLTERQKAIKAYKERVRRIERQTGKKVSQIKDLKKASTAIIKKQTTAVMKRNLLVPLAPPKTGPQQYIKERKLKKLQADLMKANAKAKKLGYEGFNPEITATTVEGFEAMARAIKEKTKLSWWREKNSRFVRNFMKSLEHSSNRENIEKVRRKIAEIGETRAANILQKEMHTDKTSVAWLFGSEDAILRERWNDLFNIFDIPLTASEEVSSI